jgi:hypothetical protein
MEKDVYHSMLFPNGQIATFGFDGQQIPELQGTDCIELRKKILERVHPDGKGADGFGIPEPFPHDAPDLSESYDEMEMPCRCWCGEWFDLEDGHKIPDCNEVECESCHGNR